MKQELNERADAINQLLQKQQAQEQSLNRREQELYERELEVFEREITVMIREQNIDHMQIAYEKNKKKPKNPFANWFKKIKISPPQGNHSDCVQCRDCTLFCHFNSCINIRVVYFVSVSYCCILLYCSSLS